MSTEPDPQVVREMAREYLADRISEPSDVGAYVLGHLGPLGDDLTKHEYGAWCSAIRADLCGAVPTWPHEQPQAERDADVRAMAEAVDALDFVLENGYSADVVEGARAALHARFADGIAALDARTTDGGALCTCGCPLGKPCGCVDSADHHDPNAVDPADDAPDPSGGR